LSWRKGARSAALLSIRHSREAGAQRQRCDSRDLRPPGRRFTRMPRFRWRREDRTEVSSQDAGRRRYIKLTVLTTSEQQFMEMMQYLCLRQALGKRTADNSARFPRTTGLTHTTNCVTVKRLLCVWRWADSRNGGLDAGAALHVSSGSGIAR